VVKLSCRVTEKFALINELQAVIKKQEIYLMFFIGYRDVSLAVYLVAINI